MLISVIGNAQSIMDTDSGALIDVADLVVRLTFGVPIKPVSQGKKTSVVISSTTTKKNYPRWPEGTTYWWSNPSPERERLTGIIGYQPSNGIVALEMVKNRYPDADVNVFGFDWKATRTFYTRAWVPLDYTPDGWFSGHEKHDYVSERKYCLQLIKDMGWTLL